MISVLVHTRNIGAMSTSSLLCLLVIVIIFYCNHLVAADDDCTKGAKSNTMALKKKMFCSYDSSVRPVKEHTNTTDVSMHMWIKFLMFNEHYNTLEVHSWVVWKWNDEHLKWDKNEYNGLDTLQVLSSEVWIPDVTIYNSGSMYSSGTGLPETRCTVRYQGKLSCVSPTVYEAQCTPNIRLWPFDSHNCSIRVGSWAHRGEQLNLTMEKDGITTVDYEPSREWELVDVNASRVSITYKNNTYPWLTFRVELRRHPGGKASSVVTPSVVLALLTLATFCINPVSSHRLGLICVNLVCHCMYMMFLGMLLPANGDQTPVIVTFFRDSFLMVGVSLVVTLCTARMITAGSAPPSWITTITDVILALPPGQLLMLGELDPKGVAAAKGPEGAEDNAELMGVAQGTGGWRLFASLLDRLFFISFLLTLLILLCAYIP